MDSEEALKALSDGEFAAADGENLGTHLGVPQGILKNIRKNRHEQVEDMLRDILQYWIANSKASWVKLADALKKCGYGNLARKLQHHVPGKNKNTQQFSEQAKRVNTITCI